MASTTISSFNTTTEVRHFVTNAAVVFEPMLLSRFSDRLRSVNLDSITNRNRNCTGLFVGTEQRPGQWKRV